MKPNFALDLSHDGIGLLHRGMDGWHSVGSVSLEDPEFSDKLGFLRQTAVALESSGVTTKLVIPNSQIRFIMVDAPGPTDADRIAQVRAALVDATPYTIDELAFDWTEVEGTVHVAAVARKTLDEAESFANEHGFNPVSFVATPIPGTFSTAEPFFGLSNASETLLDKSVTVEPDTKAIRVMGPEITATAEAPAASETEEPEIVQTPDLSITQELDAAPPPEPEAEPVIEQEPVDEPVEAPVEAPVIVGVTAAQLPSRDDQIPDTPAPAFTSRRETKTATDDGQTLHRIEEIESRLAILPEGRTSLAPKLAGASRGDEKTTPEPDLHEPPSPPAARSRAKTPKTAKPAAKITPPLEPATPLDLSETEMPATYPDAETEEQAMTVFGARKKTVRRGKPRYLGLSLMVFLLVILGTIVLWSTFFLRDETAFWHGNQNETVALASPSSTTTDPEIAAATDPVNDALAMLTEPTIRRETPTAEILAPPPLGTVETEAVAEVATPADPQTPPATVTTVPTPLTPQAAQTAYLDTGIWQLAPKPPVALREDEIDTLYITSVDPHIASQDAIALPRFPSSSGDTSLELQSSPAAHSTAFVLDDRGLVIPSVDGTLTPDGVLVFAGPPPVKPGVRGNRVPQVVVEPDLTVTGFRPKPRPADLVQQSETAQETEQLGGYTRVQLASFRPKPRPYEVRTPQNGTAAEPEEAVVPEGPASALAVVLSSAPQHRPRGFAKLVERSRAAAPSERATAATAVPRNQTVQPSAPSRASVARLATTKDAINLRRTSLIGIYGSPSKRRALVRLSNGRYVKVKVGERVDGGKVAAIGQSELRYVKGGRTIILRMPKS